MRVEPAHVQLRKIRREAGLSQNEVARRLGMDVLEYCRLESGCEEINEAQYSALHNLIARLSVGWVAIWYIHNLQTSN